MTHTDAQAPVRPAEGAAAETFLVAWRRFGDAPADRWRSFAATTEYR